MDLDLLVSIMTNMFIPFLEDFSPSEKVSWRLRLSNSLRKTMRDSRPTEINRNSSVDFSGL